ncbi:Fur family zinc uptake transcriptional regulator [Pullulanibacillus pueri]|uniref:Transcriptional repressor n=1 Tax=Pullulanibacillus pueri TaxID=1437324 RepID=A0A8J2ZTP2_9BACL|nr:Fur family transcriptional regulator [Pullulanibacillus pueri]MBM7681069.1 Fur family zinc uptake transcriptional regulator [Pullulanibacillus pueri]GGH76925.1 transcriptional repressor [Pullulanibacillus pueri]
MTIDEALQQLKEKGYKITHKREEILEFLKEQNRYTSVKEVIDHLKADYPGLSFETIYRNLALFAELGILEETELEGEKRFQLSCGTDHHHHHLICLSCGKTRTIQNCPMISVPEIADFDITGHKFEVYGYCEACR